MFHFVSTEWIKKTTFDERKQYINSLLNIFLDYGITSFNDRNENPIYFARKVKNQYNLLDPAAKDFIQRQNNLIMSMTTYYYQLHIDDIK